jgi:hypothetical protein
MKVKEVIDKCEELLEVESTKEGLLDCFNLIENELALNYLPLYTTHSCHANKVSYDELEYSPIRIVGCNCKFKIYPTYIESKEAITEIKYAYTPDKKELYDECSYSKEFLECLAYGTVSEYLLSMGFYEESSLWNKKYKKQIELLML